jgi:tetratricopeptide (TPR) repeat protein
MNLLDIQMKQRQIRVFISSTFRDMHAERDCLAKKIFPQLRHFCRSRGIEFTDIDLRWGVTEDQVQQGRVIEICLNEIERCRPYFIGLLGHRYGWVPGVKEYTKFETIAKKIPWVKDGVRNGLSITEMEIQYGVLCNQAMDTKAFFYLRDESASAPEFREITGSDEEHKLLCLREAVKRRTSWKPFDSLEKLQAAVLEDFKGFLDREFPQEKQLSRLERQRMEHAAFARSRLRVYVGGEKYFAAIDAYTASKTTKPLLVTGDPGIGKSALLVNWMRKFQVDNPDIFIFYHAVGYASDSADHYGIMRRLIAEISNHFCKDQHVPAQDEMLQPDFQGLLASASERIIVIIDGLDRLEEKGNAKWLGWWPDYLRPNIRVIMASRHGQTTDLLKHRGFPLLTIEPIKESERKNFIEKYLESFSRELRPEIIARIARDPKSANPLILQSILDELRLFGEHERLEERIGYYLDMESPESFFSALLQRLDEDFRNDRPGMTGEILSYIITSREGLSEKEILEITGIPPLFWTPFYDAIDSYIINRNGLLYLAHDSLCNAVKFRYLNNEECAGRIHGRVAEYFISDKENPRALREVPWHLLKIKHWKDLERYLVDIDVFMQFADTTDLYELHRTWTRLEDVQRSDPSVRCDRCEGYNKAFEEHIIKKQLSENECVRIAVRLSSFYEMADRYAEALDLWNDMEGYVQNEYGLEKPETAACLYRIAGLQVKTGQIDEAEKNFRQSLYIRKKVFNPGHPDIAASLGGVAQVLYIKKVFGEAELLLREALYIQQNVYGPGSQNCIEYLNMLGLVLYERHVLDEAEEILRQALKITENTYGPQHPDTGQSLNNLGLVILSKGEIDAAETLFKRALSIMEKSAGSENSQITHCLNNLGLICYCKGDYETSKGYFVRSLKGKESTFGMKHPETLKTAGNLLGLLDKKGELEEAQALAKRYGLR